MVEFYEVNENDIESYLTYTKNDYLFFMGIEFLVQKQSC
jgi:hypothetical protein